MPTQITKNRKRFPTLKVIAYDINEIWSLDLAYVNKFARREQKCKTLVSCGGLSFTLSTIRTLKIKVGNNNTRYI